MIVIYKEIVATIIALFLSAPTETSVTYEFQNSDFSNVNIVGLEASNAAITFGGNAWSDGDEFAVLVGSTAGASDLIDPVVYANGNGVDIPGFSFGAGLPFKPTSDTFYVTLVVTAGNTDFSDFQVGFDQDGTSVMASGSIIEKQTNAPSPLTWVIVLAGFAFAGVMLKRRKPVAAPAH